MKKYLFLWIGLIMAFTNFGYSEISSENQWTVWSGSDGNDFEIYFARHEGSSWSKPTRLNQDNAQEDIYPSLAVDASGKPFVAWVRTDAEGSRDIYCSKWNGIQWSQEELVGETENIQFSEPSVALDQSGNPFIVVAGVKEGDESAQDEIYWTRFSSGWSSWSRLNEEDTYPDLDPVSLWMNGKIWVVWSGYDGQKYQLFVRVWDQEKWSPEEKLFSEPLSIYGEFPSLSIQGGTPHLIFYSDEKPFSSEWDGKEWSAPVSTVLPLESTFIDLWKNQGVFHSQVGWYGSEKDRGSIRIFTPQDLFKGQNGLAMGLKKFFDISGDEAWAAVTPGVYIAFGDSITQGPPNPGASYVPSLSSKLGKTVTNRGKGGEKTSGGVSRIDSVLNADNGEFILIMEGTNDVAAGRSQESVAFNLSQMVTKSINFGTKPVIGTVTPRRDIFDGKVQHLNDLVRPLAGQFGITLADNYQAMKSQADLASLFIDHVHLSAAGAEIVAQSWAGSLGGGDGGGGGGCGTIQQSSGGPWSMNLEPIIFLIFAYVIYRKLAFRRA